MARRRRTRPLQELCLRSVAEHMDRLWCREYEQQYAGQFVMYSLGPFEYMTNANIQSLISLLTAEARIRRVHLELLLLTNLTRLHLHFPKHVKITLNAVSKLVAMRCQKLTELTLMSDGTKASVKHLADLVSSLPRLQYLDLSETSTNDQVITLLAANCPRISTLRVRCCPITDCSIMALCMGRNHQACENLQTLDVRGTALSPKALSMAIDKLPKLRHLLHDDVVRPLTLLHLHDPLVPERIHCLQTLSGCSFPGLPLPESNLVMYKKIVAYCPSISVINFVDLPGDECLLYFRDHPLRSVTLSAFYDDSLVSFHFGILPLIQSCGSNLEVLSLSKIDDIDVGEIGSHCPKLKTLEILQYDLQNFVVYYTEPTRPAFTKLENLALAQPDQSHALTGSFSPILETVLSSCHRLRHLSLICVTSLDDVTFHNVLLNNPFQYLESFILNECHEISAKSLEELVFSKDCSELNRLEMIQCKNIYRRDYDAMRRKLKKNLYDITVKWT